jgi:hypothetical protein
MCGTKLNPSPASTSTMGYGTFSLFAITAKPATMTSNSSTTLSTAWRLAAESKVLSFCADWRY